MLLAVFPLPFFAMDMSCFNWKDDEMEEEKEARKMGSSFARKSAQLLLHHTIAAPEFFPS